MRICLWGVWLAQFVMSEILSGWLATSLTGSPEIVNVSMAIKAFSEIKESNMVSEAISDLVLALQCHLWSQSSTTLASVCIKLTCNSYPNFSLSWSWFVLLTSYLCVVQDRNKAVDDITCLTIRVTPYPWIMEDVKFLVLRCQHTSNCSSTSFANFRNFKCTFIFVNNG